MSPKAPPKTPSRPTTPKKEHRKKTPLDPISANKIWADECNKTERMNRMVGPFQLDVRKLIILAEKPNYITPDVKDLDISEVCHSVTIPMLQNHKAFHHVVDGNGKSYINTVLFHKIEVDELGAVTMKEYEEAIKLMEKVDPIKQRDSIPPEKYNLPLTVAQEYGWYSKPLIKTHPLFTYPKNMCEITEYADCYYRSQGRNPFQRKESITKESKEDKGKGKEGEGKPKTPPPKK